MDRITPVERKLIRALLFALKPFKDPEGDGRAKSLALTLTLAEGASEPFGHPQLETALLTQRRLDGTAFLPDAFLEATATHWRIVLLLKTFRHASEYAFGALYDHVTRSPIPYRNLRDATDNLVESLYAASGWRPGDPEPCHFHSFGELLDKVEAGSAPPALGDESGQAASMLWWAIRTLAWAYRQTTPFLKSSLLEERAASLGLATRSSLRDYHAELTTLATAPLQSVARWLLLDRGVSRHNTVAARKLQVHDTFRLVEDEHGVQVRSGCPLSPVQVRTETMLSLLGDLKLLRRTDEGYLPTESGQRFLSRYLTIAGGA